MKRLQGRKQYNTKNIKMPAILGIFLASTDRK